MKRKIRILWVNGLKAEPKDHGCSLTPTLMADYFSTETGGGFAIGPTWLFYSVGIAVFWERKA